MLFNNQSTEPKAVALYDSLTSQWLTYGQLQEKVLRLSEYLKRRDKALIFCFCSRNIPTINWYLAALYSGHAVAMLDQALSAELRQALIARYEPEFIVGSVDQNDGSRSNFHTFDRDSYDELVISEAAHCAWRRKRDARGAIHEKLSLLLSTSGTTGSPKFVRLTRVNLLSNANSIVSGLGINSEERPIISLPFHYSYGLSVLNSHLQAGSAIVNTSEGMTSAKFWHTFRETQCTSIAGVPYSYQILKRLGIQTLDLPSLKTMTQAGGKLQPELISYFHDEMRRRKGKFFVMYGQTEATARISILDPDRLPEKLGSVGQAIAGGRLSVLVDGTLTEEPEAKGELVYTGPNVMMGYALSRQDLELGDTFNGQLRTGDLAHCDRDGFAYIHGRCKRDAKIFGLRINLDEVEGMLRQHGPSAVIEKENRLVIFFEQADRETLAARRAELSSKLMIHHQALEFRSIDRIPTTDSGKINYSVLSDNA